MTSIRMPSVLVVDGNVAQMRALCDTLESEGYLTRGCSSARQALCEMRSGRFDLLLTDLAVPEIDGIGLLQGALEIDAALAAVVMTGHIDTATKALQLGALDYIEKPFSRAKILPVLGRALNIRRLRIEIAALSERERNYVAELESANLQLAAIAASISHDLRNPLHTITGFCELYLRDFGANVAEEGRELLDQVLKSSRRMDQLLGDLLRFLRLGRQELTKCPVPLDLIVRRVVRSLQDELTDGRVELTVGSLPECEADPSLIEQVFVNLIGNALKFSRHRSPAIIEIGMLEKPDEWVVFVRDNGAGFDHAYSAKLFGVFQRLHSITEFEGSGVGLSIVRQIVARHGGRVWAEGEMDRGAAFFFSLPREPVACEDASRAGRSSS